MFQAVFVLAVAVVAYAEEKKDEQVAEKKQEKRGVLGLGYGAAPALSYAAPALAAPAISYATPALAAPAVSYATSAIAHAPTLSYAAPALAAPALAAPALAAPAFAAPSLAAPALAAPAIAAHALAAPAIAPSAAVSTHHFIFLHFIVITKVQSRAQLMLSCQQNTEVSS